MTALTQPTPEDLRKEIRRCRTMTNKPFGVNLTLLPAMVPPDYGAYAQVIIDEKINIVETALEVLGILTALTQPTPEDLRKEIRRCRTMTNKPFGVNLTLLPAMVPPDYGAYAQVIIDEKINIVETALEV